MISLTSPVETRAHDWPAGVKLALLCAATMVLFFIEDPVILGLFSAFTLVLYVLPGRRFFTSGLGRLRILWPFLLIIGVWHLVIGEWREGAAIALRMVTTVGLANLVTMTTRLGSMMELVTWLCRPLRQVGLPPERVGIAMALVIRFIPVLADKGNQLALAWRARSRRRLGWGIVLPFAVLAIDDAEHVADALRARGGL
jgi:biotin transport system permease protein